MLDLDPILLLPLALVLLLMALPVISRKIWGPVTYVPVHIVKRMQDSNESMLLLDLRDRKAYSQAHIDGAINVTPDRLDDFLQGSVGDDRPIVLVCQSDLSATRHAARLAKAGYDSAAAMKGGMFAWKRAKYPTLSKA
ncbi:MAG: rhodanese-like domain-containing protein [Rhodospirillales bacterium]